MKSKAEVEVKSHDMLSQIRKRAKENGQTFSQTKKYKKGKFAFAYFDRKTGDQVSDLLTIREAYSRLNDCEW